MVPKITAHRGASKEAPENTLSSLRAALSLNVHYIEIDVRLTKDNTPVLLHDPCLKRTGLQYNMPLIHELEEHHLQYADVGAWFGDPFIGEPLPHLEQALSLNWNGTGMMLEIKECPQPPTIVVGSIIEAINKAQSNLPHLILGSFCPKILSEAQNNLNKINIHTSLIGIAEKKSLVSQFLDMGIRHVAIWSRLATPQYIEHLKNHGVEVWVFTVDKPVKALDLINDGVDGIITNDPRKLLNHINPAVV